MTAPDLPLLLFVASAFLGILPAPDRRSCWPALAWMVAGLLIYGLLSRGATTRRQWTLGAGVFISAGALLSLYAALEDLGLAGVGATAWAPHLNSVATFIEGLLFLAVGLALSDGQGPSRPRLTMRIAAGLAAGLMGLALALTGSQGAWLAVSVAGLLWLAHHWQPARWAAVTNGAVALGLSTYVLIRGDIAALEELPILGRALSALFFRPDRLAIYRESAYLIGDMPFTGIGYGEQFGMVHARYALLIQHVFLRYAHNLYLDVWLEQGLLGAVALLWLMAALYQAIRVRSRSTANARLQSTWLGLTAIFFHGLTDARQFIDGWCWLPFFGLLGLTAAHLRRRPAAPIRRPWLAPAIVAGGFLLAVALAFAPWGATWHANRGALLQAQAELAPSLAEEKQQALMEEAIANYRRALEIAPEDRTARQRLGWILLSERRFEEAAEELEIAWQTAPANTTTRKALGLAYVWTGKLTRARPLLADVPGIIEELNNWGWWWATEGEIDRARHAYRASLLLAPDQPAITQRLDALRDN